MRVEGALERSQPPNLTNMVKKRMKTLVERLVDEARAAHTGPGQVYLVRLLRPREDDVSEAYERLGRAVPIDVLRLPNVETFKDLGGESEETPWVAILHGDDCMLVPLSRFNQPSGA
jgi:hypothetical protein